MRLTPRASSLLWCITAVALVACADGEPEAAAPDTTAGGDTTVAPAAPKDPTITIDEIRSWYEATHRIEELKRSDRAFADTILTVREREDVAAIAAAIEEIPRARDAIEEAGLTPASYLEIGFALYRARAVDDAIEDGAIAEAPTHLNRANVALVQEHRDEIDRLHADVTDR